ncbi:MAG: hypothetical protein E6R04_11595 [Spirochaetes bacterium]|nr:MAG: hypothetical protein E6R04_11595 [Spirochaetota bacterium]
MDNSNLPVTAPTANQIASFFDTERLTQMSKMAEAFAKSGAFGKDVANGYVALAKIQAGFEMGMAPMEAMNSLYIVNGHISIWGTAQSRLLKRKGYKLQYEDKDDEKGQPIECKVTVSKGDEVYIYTAMASEVKDKQGYKIAPKNKLRWHGLGQIIRFDIPEVMDAGISYLAEEVEDMSDERPKVSVVEDEYFPPVSHYIEFVKMVKSREEYLKLKEDAQKHLSKYTPEDRQALLEAFAKVGDNIHKEETPSVPMGGANLEITKISGETNFHTNELKTQVHDPVNLEKDRVQGGLFEKPVSTVQWTPEYVKKVVGQLETARELTGLLQELRRVHKNKEITPEQLDQYGDLIMERMGQLNEKYLK